MPSNLQMGPLALAVLQHYEQGPNGGFAPKVYKDSGGRPTVGWGHLVLPGEKFDKELDLAAANALMYKDAQAKVRQVNALLDKCGIKATQQQFDAILCLVYNTGVGVRDGKRGDVADSDIMKNWMAGDLKAAAHSFLDWNKETVGGKLIVRAGLTRRRMTEEKLFLTGTLQFQF